MLLNNPNSAIREDMYRPNGYKAKDIVLTISRISYTIHFIYDLL